MIKYILTDIEGTTTSISFVVDTLFPYFLEHINEVATALDNPLVQSQISLVKETVLQEENKNIDDRESLNYLVKWCKEDRKHPALKALQGMV
jgi:enolase-phosphatase E1